MTVRAGIWKEARPFVAIALAYAIAAQALIVGAVSGQIAAAGPAGTAFAICYGAGPGTTGNEGNTGKPAHPNICTLCAAVTYAPAIASAGAPVFEHVAHEAAERPRIRGAITTLHERSEKNSQGPPRTA